MRLSTRRPVRPSRRPRLIETLESRELFTATVVQPLPNVSGNPNTVGAVISLTQAMQDPDVDVVRLTTPQGTIDIATFVKDAPLNAANFLQYVNNGSYDNSIFQRSEPGFVLQGGSIKADGTEIEPFAPVKNEFSASRSNVRGTVAFAKLPPDVPGGGPDSATSAFFFNLSDNNASNLDNQNGGFTVFGRVLGDDMGVVDTLVGIPNALNRLVQDAAVIGDVTYTVTSSNPALVTPSLDGGNLTLTYGATPGTAEITVTATDINGQSVSDVFKAGVGQLEVEIGGDNVPAVDFKEADSTAGVIAIAKGGRATVTFSGTDLTQTVGRRSVSIGGTVAEVLNVQAFDTTTATTLSVRGRGGDAFVQARGLSTTSPLKTLDARNLHVIGDVTVGGTVRTAAIGWLADGTLTIGGTVDDNVDVALDLPRSANYAVSSGSEIRSIKARTFENDVNAIRAVTAPSIGTIAATGDVVQNFVASSGSVGAVKFNGDFRGTISANTVKSMSVRGDMNTSVVNLDEPFSARGRALGSLKVGGDLASTTVNAASNVGPVTVGGASTDSSVTAGLVTLSPPFAVPSTLGEFASEASIASFKARSFAGSTIAARTLGRITLGTVTIDNGGATFGVAADTIAAISGSTGPNVNFNFRKLDDPAAFQQQLTASGLDLDDMVIRVL